MKYKLFALLFAVGSIAAARDQLSVDSNVVLINATVLDRHDRLVRGLTRDRFRIFEDNSEQKIAYFSEEEVPVSLAVLFDVSGSMDGKIAGMRTALAAVLSDANPSDESSLIPFSDEPHLAIGWTPDPAQIQNGVLLTHAHGDTALLDAIKTGLTALKTAHNARKAMVIFSDGGDNHSRSTEREVRQALVESGVQIYAIDLTEPLYLRSRSPEEIAGPDLLERICDYAGGRHFQVDGRRELAAAAEQISRELRSEYLIGFVPSPQVRDGRFHHVRLQLKREDGNPKVSVFWRRGYRAPNN